MISVLLSTLNLFDIVEAERQEAAKKMKSTTDWIHLHLQFASFGILGFLARIGVEKLTQYQGSLGGVLWANFGGSLVMGYLVHWPFFSTAKEARTVVAYTAKADTPLYVAMTTGFCGSFTSLSSFILVLFEVSANKPAHDLPFPGPAWGVPMWFAYALVELCVSTTAFTVGRHLAQLATPPWFALTQKQLRMAHAGLSAAGALMWTAAVGLTVVASLPGTTAPHSRLTSTRQAGGWRYWALGMAFTPPGVYSRFWISRILNPRFFKGRFFAGTFTANVGGTVLLAVLMVLRYGGGGAAVDGGRPGLKCDVVQALADGYCGALTTVSTFVAELFGLPVPRAYVYGFASVMVSYGCMVLIYGTYVSVFATMGRSTFFGFCIMIISNPGFRFGRTELYKRRADGFFSALIIDCLT